MSTKTSTKSKISDRYQITYPKNSSISKRIKSLLIKFDGMDLPEITKLALIELDNKQKLQSPERIPDEFEQKAIDNFIANPDVLTAEESKKYLQDLRMAI